MAATSTSKGTTYRLFKVAAELNIGKETIVEFLRAKGHDISVKPTSTLSQEMYDIVMDKFEKEHRQIEKQRKKVDAYHEKRVRVKDEPATAEVKRERKEEGAEPETVEAQPLSPVVEEQAEPTPAPEREQAEPIVAAAPAEPGVDQPVEAPRVEPPVVETPQAETPRPEPAAPVVAQEPPVRPETPVEEPRVVEVP